MNLDIFKQKYEENGTCYLTKEYSPFSEEDCLTIEKMCKDVPKEFIEIGDAGEPNHLWVGRFQTDVKSPKIVNKKFSKDVMETLNNNTVMSFVSNILGISSKLFIRRVQFNKIEKNCFIGYHLDTDSNPDYIAACVIQFGEDYKGGLYRVYQNKVDFIDYAADRFSLIISNCSYPHEVTKVIDGSRQSLVFFFSEHDGINKQSEKP